MQIQVNQHRDYYETVEEYIKEEEERQDIEDDVFLQMVDRDTIVLIIAYPDNPIGSFAVYHYDLDKAIALMIALIENKQQ